MWTEGKIGRILARGTFANDLCVLPNCTWTGDEIDLLVVTQTRRIIDVEIKISRADLKADREKRKWWRGSHPQRVWKHYYAMPAELWRDDLREFIQPVSGVLLLHDDAERRLMLGYKSGGRVECVKRAKPNQTPTTIGDRELVQIARLTSLRMWDAYKQLEQATA